MLNRVLVEVYKNGREADVHYIDVPNSLSSSWPSARGTGAWALRRRFDAAITATTRPPRDGDLELKSRQLGRANALEQVQPAATAVEDPC